MVSGRGHIKSDLDEELLGGRLSKGDTARGGGDDVDGRFGDAAVFRVSRTA
jgi:hypothetical protein